MPTNNMNPTQYSRFIPSATWTGQDTDDDDDYLTCHDPTVAFHSEYIEDKLFSPKEGDSPIVALNKGDDSETLKLTVFLLPDSAEEEWLCKQINLADGDRKQRAELMNEILLRIENGPKERRISFMGWADSSDRDTIKFLMTLIDNNAARVTCSRVKFKEGPGFEHTAGWLVADRERGENWEEIMCGSRPKSMKVEIGGDESFVSFFSHFLRNKTQLMEKRLNQDELNGKRNSITITYDADA
ncbi:hypothetical protein CPC08DRAFT_723585 [Agrocybe pediades]|nr:hypothetical protein CPC08DRAFT_723585 [Agrocybe pediades]